MAHDPFGVERLPQRFIAAEFYGVFKAQAEAVHASVDVNGRIGGLIDAAGNAGPIARLFERVDDGLQLCAEQHAFVARGRAVENIDGGIGAHAVAQHFAFARCRDEENPAARAVKRFGHGDRAETVGIGFHTGANLRRANTGFQGFIIRANLREIDTQGGPRRIAGLIDEFRHERALDCLSCEGNQTVAKNHDGIRVRIGL